MKKLTIILVIIFTLLLSGCNLPASSGPAEQSDESMATEIAKILTGTPVQILISPTPETQLTEAGPEETQSGSGIVTITPGAEDPTATTEPTVTLTPTITPTATLSASDPALTLGNPDWVDDMDDGDNWATGEDDYSKVSYADGYMKIITKTAYDAWRLTWANPTNFYLEAKLQTPECSGSDHYGLMFRSPRETGTDQGYLFAISCDGKYNLRSWNAPNMTWLINWTESDQIHQGADVQNTLGVMAKGSTIALYINGEKVDQIENNTYSQGVFGIFVGGANTDDLTLWADQIRYWDNP